MENEINPPTTPRDTGEDGGAKNTKRDYSIAASILLSAILLAGAWVYTSGRKSDTPQAADLRTTASLAEILEEKVLPPEGVLLPVAWNDLGQKLVQAGVIDDVQFEELVKSRGGLSEEMKQLLYGADNGSLKISENNAGFILNLFWALGLANKNEILEKGPMMDPQYGGAGNFASTGGWTLAKGDTMDHYSRHSLVSLNKEQQLLVERVSQNIYRPCCGNSTYFPDCNHGMAMLGLLELMASQGASEEEMYRVALRVNSYWFPDTYLTIAKYLESQGINWDDADPKELLGYDFSSASGYRNILSKVAPPEKKSGGGCGV